HTRSKRDWSSDVCSSDLKLLKSDIQIYEYRPALLHAKTMVVDGLWSTVGSTNLDRRSFALNEELNVAIYDVDTAQRLERVFEERSEEHTSELQSRFDLVC